MSKLRDRNAMTPEERRADDDRFGNLSSAKQIRELKNLLAEVEAAISEAERKSKAPGS